MTRIRALAALAVLALAAGAGCSDEASTTPAATVNGIEISSQEVVDELESIRANERFLALTEEQLAAQGGAVLGEEDDTFNSAFVAETLTTRILYTIVESAVEEGGYEVDDACLAAAEDEQALQFDSGAGDGQAILDAFDQGYRDYLVRRFANVIALQGGLAGYPCTVLEDDAILERYFEEHAEEFTQRCVTVVQFADPLAAEEFRGQVEAGGDFEALGAALSPEVGSLAEVGCDSTQQLLEVVPALADMAAGEVSPVFLVGDLPVILRVDEVREADFEAQREAVATAIRAEIDQAFSEWLDAELRAADVQVDPRYGTWNRNEETGELPAIERPQTDTTEPEAGLVPED